MAIVAVIVIGVLLLSVTVWFSRWALEHTRGSSHTQARERAIAYAESGLTAAEHYLQMPMAGQSAVYTSSSTWAEGRYEYTIQISTGPFGTLRATVLSSGWFGTQAAPVQIEAGYSLADITWITIAAAGPLRISSGMLSEGIVYAGSLVFAPPPSGSPVARFAGGLCYYGTV
jgi:hypothetical protein